MTHPDDAEDPTTAILSMLAGTGLAIALLLLASMPAQARERGYVTSAPCSYDNNGRVTCMGALAVTRERATSRRHRAWPVLGAKGTTVKSSRGIAVRVSPGARAALQCVVDHVEAAGARIKAMRGYGNGTVRGSLHPSGRALDINQVRRDVTSPHIPRSVANAAADKCGVISGARWGYADNGHWNLAVHGRATQEPWPRVLSVAR